MLKGGSTSHGSLQEGANRCWGKKTHPSRASDAVGCAEQGQKQPTERLERARKDQPVKRIVNALVGFAGPN